MTLSLAVSRTNLLSTNTETNGRRTSDYSTTFFNNFSFPQHVAMIQLFVSHVDSFLILVMSNAMSPLDISRSPVIYACTNDFCIVDTEYHPHISSIFPDMHTEMWTHLSSTFYLP
jgi:hypothetical protein